MYCDTLQYDSSCMVQKQKQQMFNQQFFLKSSERFFKIMLLKNIRKM